MNKEFELLSEEAKRLIDEMVENIVSYDADIKTEVLFTANCLEVLTDKEFTPDEQVKVCYELLRILKARLKKMIKIKKI